MDTVYFKVTYQGMWVRTITAGVGKTIFSMNKSHVYVVRNETGDCFLFVVRDFYTKRSRYWHS